MSAEDFATVREALVGHGGMKRTPGHAEWREALAALARLEARLAEVEATVEIYRNAEPWNQERDRKLRAAETRVEALTAALREIADVCTRKHYEFVQGQRGPWVVHPARDIGEIARAALATSEQAERGSK